MYGALYLLMLPALFWASSWTSFQETYPFYDRAAEGGAAYWLYALGYPVQFVGVEAFFRGFMTFGLLRRFGAFAIPIMTIPYVMIHFAKPMPEAVAAIFAGLILGYLAVRSKSFVPGFVLHVAVAMTMDLLVLWRIGALGAVF
jgi:membrane protease YdiL (CAAX protease family)